MLEPVSPNRPMDWPAKVDLFGVGISVTDYDLAVAKIFEAVDQRQSAVVACQAVHAVVTACEDPELLGRLNSFDLVTPDGQPVRWAMNLLHRTGLTERVYGPELMLRVCARAAQAGTPIYLYGGTPESVKQLCENLAQRWPDLIVAGAESPPFRALTAEEDQAVVKRINASGAGILFIGLGCPKQDHFAFEHRDRISAVQMCVGAAFDFHAGTKSMAPAWMQKRGLEWVYRLWQEPRRLWRRYLVTNSIFVAKLATALFQRQNRKKSKTVAANPSLVATASAD